MRTLGKLTMALAAAAAITTAGLGAPRPVAAQSTGTVNTLIGAAALLGGIVLYNNYEHKRQAADTVVGYTDNGGTVYGDGRVVMPDGTAYYPNDNGQYQDGQYAYWHPNAENYDYLNQNSHRHDWRGPNGWRHDNPNYMGQ